VRARRVLLVALAAVLLVASPAGAATIRKGPAGLAFYTPPSPLPGAAHGDVIWARKLTGQPALKSAGSNQLVLYRSTGLDGRPTAVSGTVSLPKGKAPKAGWPVITWAHGTTGIADQCAPSRDTAGNPDHVLTSYVYPQLNAWLKAGYAVVRTDYEGLGTPGVHPYLNGRSEGRAVLDMVRAARKLTPALGKRYVIAGHSQGGQAALFAARLAPSYAGGLQLRGTLAYAPVSHLSEQIPLARGITDPNPGISSFAALIARGVDVARPQLNVASLLSDRARALYPQADERCLLELRGQDSFGAIPPAEIFRSDADFNPFTAALDQEDDAENLTIHTTVRIEQGSADTTVLPAFTDQLAQAYQQRKTPLVYKKYPGVDHGSIVGKAETDALKWLRTRLGRPHRSS
jgi:pimeloyl-ACP methyl ester carboxylesterase